MIYEVEFSPESLDSLDAIEQYIANTGSPMTAARYVDAIVTFCHELASFPQRGTKRDDIMPGLRITNYRRNAVVAFQVYGDTKKVSIVGIFYGGQNYETFLQSDVDE